MNTEPRRLVVAEWTKYGTVDGIQEGRFDVADLPVVPVGTSIRLEFTEDGWVDRGELRSIRLGSLPGPTTVHPPVRLWVDAPSSTPCVLSPSTETTE